MSDREKLVVIGNGMAGARMIEEIVSGPGAERFDIRVFGEEPHGNYNRILLSGLLSGAQDAAGILTHPLDWYAENGITLYAGERAVSIDRGRRIVKGASGREVAYGRLILATGSRPNLPPVENLSDGPGVLKQGAFLFRSLDDCRTISAYAAGRRRAVVLGGGLLGLEAAYGLQQLGLEVEILHRSGHLMNRQLDRQGGEILRSTVESMGMPVRLRATAAALLGEECVQGVVLQGGEKIACDMIVLACGIRPNVELASACGLRVEQAICVDDRLRTSDPDIYAVGECVQHRGRVYGLVAPLWEQAQVLAQHLTGRQPESAYTGSRVATRLKVMGIELTAMGLAEPEETRDEVVQFLDARRGVYKKLIIRDGALAGAIFLGDGRRAPYVTQAFDRGTPLPEERAALLFDLGGPAGAALEDLAGDALVCHCNGVTGSEIRDCVEGGGCSLQSVMRCTRAATGCGSCKGLVRELIDQFMKKGAGRAAALAEAA